MTQNMNTDENLLTLAAADPGTQAAQVIRDSANQIATCIASMLDYLEEPLKGKFLEVKNQINAMLAGLPETDKVPAALDSNLVLQQLLSILGCAQSMMTNLTEAAKGANEKLAATRASLGQDIEAAITAKVTAGDLVKKADAETRVTNAVNQARSDFQQEQRIVSERRLALNSLSLPVPADDKLTGKDEDFNARRDTAKARIDKLKEFKIAPERLVTLAWNTDQAAFEQTLELLKDAAGAAKTGKPNAFITPTSKQEPDLKKRVGMI